MATVKRQRKGKKWIILLVLLGVGALVVLALTMNPPVRGGLEYTISFQESRGLEQGDNVTLAGKRIGQVEDVKLNPDAGGVLVDVAIEREYADRIKPPPNSSARIVNKGWLFPRARVEIVNRGSSEDAMDSGSRVEGLESWTSEQTFRGKAKAREGVTTAVSIAEESLESAKEWASDSEASSLRERIDALRLEMKEVSLEKAADAQARAAELMEKGKEVSQELYRYGREDLATQLEGSLVEIKDQVDKRLEQPEPVEGEIVERETVEEVETEGEAAP